MAKRILISLALAACTDPSPTDEPHIGPRMTTVAGANTDEPGLVDGPAADARFAYPEGLALDPSANILYIADGGSHTVRKLDLASGMVTTIAGMGYPGSGPGFLQYPRNLALTPDGAGLYITDTGNHVIRHLDLATGELTTAFGSLGTPGYADGVGTQALFGGGPFRPWSGGMMLDPSPAGGPVLYVADSGNEVIRKIELASGMVTTIAGRVNVRGAADGAGASATFNKPAGLALGAPGVLLVAEANNLDLRAVDLATYEVTTVAGQAPGNPDHFCENISPVLPPECGDTDAPRGVDARFRFPFGLAADGTGGTFVVDSHSNALRHYDGASTAVSTVAGVPSEVLDDLPRPSLDSSPLAAGTFSHPSHVAFLPPNQLFVSDRSANCIRLIELE